MSKARSANVLVLDNHAEVYGQHLTGKFPGIGIQLARSLKDVPADLSHIDVLIAFGIAIDDALMQRLSGLKWVQSLATGVDHFLKCPHMRPQAALTSARGIHGPGMRESVAFLMLALSRDAPRLVANKAAKRWDRGQPWTPLNGQTAVVAGIGVGGIAIGRLLKAFGMHVIGLSRTPRDIEGFDEIIATDRIVEAARRADWLIGILPGDEANSGLISRAVFAAMRPTARFINVGRGSTVDEGALIDALQSGRLAGAGLDVFATSPLPLDSPLWSLPNVVISPQTGGFTSDYETMVMPIIDENMMLFLAGTPGGMRNLIAR